MNNQSTRWTKVIYLTLALLTLTTLSIDAQAPQGDGPIIADHTSTEITAVPQYWIEEAKQTLHIAYGHTSHGSQLTDGMSGLVAFANGGGKGLALPDDIFAWNNGGTGGALDLHDYAMGGDVGYYPQWVENTESYLGDPAPETGRGTRNPDVNVIIWSWCGQASGYTEQQMIDRYLTPMSALEAEYPGITFVYMTGHADGSGEEGNLHQRNQQIRQYCLENDKVLYDFYDIELYDPDGNYYGDKAVEDDCDYDSDGNGSRDRNWAEDWQNAHTQGQDWYDCTCQHSRALNCNQKAYAAWWLWARIAGWNGGTATLSGDVALTSRPGAADQDETISHTLTLANMSVPPIITLNISVSPPLEVPLVDGSCQLSALNGGLTSCSGNHIAWQSALATTDALTLTFATTVNTPDTDTFTTTAHITAAGYTGLTRTTTLLSNPRKVYLPLIVRQ